jgi:hypothetical protein
MINKKKYKLVLFFNNLRGLKTLYFLKLNGYEIFRIYLSKKNLNKEII